jgi:Putative peptidoglycan binding domain
MAFGNKTIKRGDKGKDVVELQLRLSGFRGTLWDGDFGPGTELQVIAFQRDYMRLKKPSGIATKKTLAALRRFAAEFPLDFALIRCQCGGCSGFGAGKFKGKYPSGKPKVEAFHQREYPGVHKAILHGARAAFFYASIGKYPSLYISSGYRCWIDNQQHDRTTTNHMGKAIDLDFVSPPNEPKAVDAERCAKFAGLLVEKGNFQVGWGANNRKAVEPDSMAPTWIHMDVRSYEPRYLADEYFVTEQEELDA